MGYGGNHDVTVADGEFSWGYKDPMGRVRYTIFVEGDTWKEIGERSKNGDVWIQFFEMNLERQ